MEDFVDDDFSDLYADVEVQASSAISALHRLAEMPPEDDKIFGKATRGNEREGDGFNGAEIARTNGGFHEHATGDEDEGGDLTNLLMENGDVCEGDDGIKQRFDDNFDNINSSFEFGAVNMRKHEGGREVEEDQKKHGGVNGTEKSVEGGDYNSQKKNLNCDSFDSKKRRVNKMASRVYKVCKNGDTNEDNGREVYFRRANEDNQPIFERNGGKIASERGSRHAHAHYHVSLDLDKHGTVQISDSAEDSQHEVSECDSDGTETSDDTNRRNSSSMFSSVPHDPGSTRSPSPCPALSDGDIDSRKHLKTRLTGVVRDFEEEITREYHQSFKDSRRHHVKPKTRAARYCKRQRGLNQHKKLNDMHDSKTHLTNEGASYVSDIKRPHNMHISHGKRCAMLNFASIKKDMPYCNQSESYLNYSDRCFPRDHLGPTYLKNRPSSKHKAGCRDSRDMSERRNFLKKNRNMNYEALEDGEYHTRRRHVQGNSEQSRKLVPKYFSEVTTRVTHFSNRGDAFRHDNQFISGKYRRFMPSGDRHRDQLDHRYDRNIAHNRRRMESSERDKRQRDNSLDSSHNLQYLESVDNNRRYIKHRPESGVPERNLRCLWKEMDIGSVQYGTIVEGLIHHHSEDHHVRSRNYQQFTNTYVMNRNMKNHHDQDNFCRRRHHQQFKVLHSRDEVYKSRHQDNTKFHSEGPSHRFERISRNNTTNDRHAFGHVTELIDEREVDRHRFTMTREDYSNQFDGYKFVQPHSCVQMHQRYRDSIDPRMIIEGKKCTLQKTSEAGNDKYNARHDLREWNDDQKHKISEDLNDLKPEKAVSTSEGKIDDANPSDRARHGTFTVNQKNEFLDVEEGQIISEEIDEDPVKCGIASEVVTSNVNGIVEGLGADKIREIMAKMEKRIERFKEPFISIRDSEKISNQLLDLDVETAEKGKLERPARKRRWF